MQEEKTATFQPIYYVAPRWVQMTAATIGVALETFDTLMYGYLAVTLSGVFFPARNPTISLLLVFVVYGLPYVVRPLGAAVLGAYGDRRGRKKALTLSIQLMMAGTAIMALMPPFALIGIVAPIGVFTARLLQAFSFGGEFGSSTAFMAEQTKARKGFYASWQSVSQKLGMVLAALFGLFLNTALSPPHLVGLRIKGNGEVIVREGCSSGEQTGVWSKDATYNRWRCDAVRSIQGIDTSIPVRVISANQQVVVQVDGKAYK